MNAWRELARVPAEDSFWPTCSYKDTRVSVSTLAYDRALPGRRIFSRSRKNLPRGACVSAEARSGAYSANPNAGVSKCKWKRPTVSGPFLSSDEQSLTRV